MRKLSKQERIDAYNYAISELDDYISIMSRFICNNLAVYLGRKINIQVGFNQESIGKFLPEFEKFSKEANRSFVWFGHEHDPMKDEYDYDLARQITLDMMIMDANGEI